MAAPLYLLKSAGLDYPWVVRVQPYLTHCPLVILNDYFIWKIGKRLIGTDGTRIAMLLLIANRFQNEHIVRCFTNGLEQIFSVIAFYFFMDQGGAFRLHTVVLTALISMAFMMRNTSPIGWIPLLAHKVLFKGSLVPFILSGIFVAIPILALCTYVDTLYYGGDKWVFTGLNFLRVNVMHGLSKYFGEERWYWYLEASAPLIYTVLYPLVLYANTVGHVSIQAKKGEPAYLTYFTCFYVVFFSLIPHKEARFLLPLIPFTLLTTG